jgi:hypothetical protein
MSIFGSAIHDRLVVVDDKEVWIVTQSFKDIAERAPASVTRFESESADLKLSSYRAMWVFLSILVRRNPARVGCTVSLPENGHTIAFPTLPCCQKDR